MEKARKSGVALFAEEAALLLLNGRPPEFDVILLVRSPLDRQLDRVKERDRITHRQILSRMGNQPTEEQMLRQADQVIDNDTDLDTFRSRSRELYRELIRKDSLSHFSKQ